MRDSASRRAESDSRRQSQRVTRDTPSDSIVFHPVSSQSGQATRDPSTDFNYVNLLQPFPTYLLSTFHFRLFTFSIGRVPYKIRRRRLDECRAQSLLPVVDAAHELTLHVFHELVHLALHLLDLAAHV